MTKQRYESEMMRRGTIHMTERKSVEGVGQSEGGPLLCRRDGPVLVLRPFYIEGERSSPRAD